MIVNIHSKEIESKNTVDLIKKLQKELNETEVLDIFDKTPEEWQKVVKSDEKIIFVGPVYWWGLGYQLDKWFQDVLKYEFAYTNTPEGMPQGLLNEKVFDIYLVHGTPEEYSAPMRNNIKERLENTFAFCNAKINIHFYTKWI